MEQITEEWRPIEEYPNYYEVSNLGNVRSVNRFVYNKTQKGRLMNRHKINSGYFIVCLSKDNKVKGRTIHRLVAKAFCGKPEGKDFVNHKNGIKTDNRAENLEWCTKSENAIHAFKTGLKKVSPKSIEATIKRNQTTHCVKVRQLTLDGQIVAEYKSIKEAAELTSCNYSNIGLCANNHPRHKTCGGYKWQLI